MRGPYSIPVFFLSVFGLFWTALVGFFDWHVGKEILGQIASTHYSSTTGQITHSELTRHAGSRGTSYNVDIRYHYEVDGLSFDGKCFRYNADSSSDSAWAKKAIADYPVGAYATVFYNPKNAADALLSPGLNGADLTIVLFLTPFNMVMLGFWLVVVTWLGRKLVQPIAGGVLILKDGYRLRVRLPPFPPLGAGMVATCVTAFALTFVVLIFSGFHPSLGFAGTALTIAYGTGLAVFLWQNQKIRLGQDDLIIDPPSGTVQLPMTFDRKDRVTVGISDISAIIVETLTHVGSKGGVSYSYAPMLQLHGKETQEKLADWGDLARAQSFAAWLRQQLGLKALPD